MQFRIQYRRSGVKYPYEYRKSIEGAIKLATARGFDDGYNSWSTVPRSAVIWQAMDEDVQNNKAWEQVATVTADGVIPVECEKRPSVQRARKRMAELEADIAQAQSTEVSFNFWSSFKPSESHLG